MPSRRYLDRSPRVWAGPLHNGLFFVQPAGRASERRTDADTNTYIFFVLRILVFRAGTTITYVCFLVRVFLFCALLGKFQVFVLFFFSFFLSRMGISENSEHPDYHKYSKDPKDPTDLRSVVFFPFFTCLLAVNLK